MSLLQLLLALVPPILFIFRQLRNQRASFLATLDPVKDAHKLLWFMQCVEFPFLSQKGTEFVIFRVLAVPSISRLIHQNKHLVKEPWKRADSTDILVKEMTHHHVDSDRGHYALRRMNAIHSQFKIPNEEYVYTLCLFALLPIEFASRYGYRKWTKNEELSSYTVWHDIGVRMGVRDIPKSIDEMREFKKKFEADNFAYSDINKVVVDGGKRLYMDLLPGFLRSVAERALSATMDEPMRVNLGFPKQNAAFEWVVNGSLKFICGICVAVFMPPRPVFMAKERIQVDWSANPPANEDEIRPLKISLYKPSVYKSGYKLAELGFIRYGKVGSSSEGSLLCPFVST